MLTAVRASFVGLRERGDQTVRVHAGTPIDQFAAIGDLGKVFHDIRHFLYCLNASISRVLALRLPSEPRKSSSASISSASAILCSSIRLSIRFSSLIRAIE